MRSFDQTPKNSRTLNLAHNYPRHPRPAALTCEAAIDHLGNYLSDDLSSAEHHALETHLAACPDCPAFLSTYKKTIEMTRDFLGRYRGHAEPVNFKLRLPSSL